MLGALFVCLALQIARAEEATPEPSPSPVASPEASPTPQLPDPEGVPEEPDAPRKKPWAAIGASALFPGGGFFYLGEPKRGVAYLAIESVELAAVGATIITANYDPDDPTSEDRLSRAFLPVLWLQNTHLVGVYDAYRAARLRQPAGRYRTPVPEPGLAGLLRAPLRGRMMLRPEIGLPLGAVAAAGVAFSLLYDGEATVYEQSRLPLFGRDVDRWTAIAGGEAYWVGSFYPVGIGEEALFRGVIQTSFEEWWGPKWGWVAASLLFGSIHALSQSEWQTALAATTITTLAGGYLGWLYQRDGHDLSAGIFFHVWYDVIVGTTAFLADPEHQPFSARITVPF